MSKIKNIKNRKISRTEKYRKLKNIENRKLSNIFQGAARGRSNSKIHREREKQWKSGIDKLT